MFLLVLEHPRRTLYFGGGCFVFFLLLFCIAAFSRQWLATGLMGFFMLLALPMVLAYVRNRHRVTECGMEFGATFGPGGQFQWQEVARVQYEAMLRRVRIETRDGRIARVPLMLLGMPQFAHVVLQRAPLEAMDAQARRALKWISLGEVPPPS